MANQLSNLGRFVYSNTSFLRVINRNLNYDANHRPAYLAIKFFVGTSIIFDLLSCVGFQDWLAARRKENSLEARTDRSQRCESAEAHLEMLEREIDAIKQEKQLHVRA